jgi:hypothetical protein
MDRNTGRPFDALDVTAGAPVVVVSEFAARRLFATLDVVGQNIRVRRVTIDGDEQPEVLTIVEVLVLTTYTSVPLSARSDGFDEMTG